MSDNTELKIDTMNIFQKINAIMDNVGSLQKDGKVDFKETKYRYLSETKTTSEMRKQLIKYKLILLPIGVKEETVGRTTIGHYVYKMVNCDNPEEYLILESGGQGYDSSDKGSGKASTYAYKYLLWRTFAIPSNDDPDQVSSDEIEASEKDEMDKLIEQEEAKQNDPITDQELKLLREVLSKRGDGAIDKCKDFFKVDSLEMLTRVQYVDAIRMINKEKK
jgi:hypothetical protein